MEATLRPLHAALQQALGDRLTKLSDLGVSPALLALGIVAALVVLEQLSYMYKRWKLGLSGPLLVVPFIGGIVEMGECGLHAPRSTTPQRGRCRPLPACGRGSASDHRRGGCVRRGAS
jgi:hypothetical protein